MHTARDQQEAKDPDQPDFAHLTHSCRTRSRPHFGSRRTGNGKARPHDHQLRRGVLRASRVVGRRIMPRWRFRVAHRRVQWVFRDLAPRIQAPSPLPAIGLDLSPDILSIADEVIEQAAIGHRVAAAAIANRPDMHDSWRKPTQVRRPAGKTGRALYIGRG